jgi:hypothetical protein
MNNDLKLKIPKSFNKWADKNSLADLLAEKKVELGQKYKNYHFYFDIGFDDPEVSCVLQLVDDNLFFRGVRRETILNDELGYVGISSFKTGNKNCVYLLFGQK